MKNKKQTKLRLDKLTISKLENPFKILGGDDGYDTKDPTKTKTGTRKSSQKCRPGGGGMPPPPPPPNLSTLKCS